MFKEAVIKIINDNPELKKIFMELSDRCRGKTKKEINNIIKEWQKEKRPVAGNQAHQTD